MRASFATNQLATNPAAIRNPLKIQLSNMAPDPNCRHRMPQACRGLKGVQSVEIWCCQCPLWVKTRHDALKTRCPLYRRKRTLPGDNWMSAKCQKQTFAYSITSSAGKIGKAMRKIEPRGWAGNAESSPECWLVIIRQSASPNPIPRDFVVTNASKMFSARLR
jgi:hypothetical protein